jgi:hypothetical protein
MVLAEVNKHIKKIHLYENVLDVMRVRLFYLQYKREKTEFKDNENRLEIIKVSHQIELQKSKLQFLNSEFNLRFEMLKSEV